MKNNKIILRLLSLALAILFAITGMTACQSGGESANSDSQSSETVSDEITGEDGNYIYRLSEFSVVRPEGYDTKIDDVVSSLCEKLSEMGIENLAVGDDHGLTSDPQRKEILIGMTNQSESENAKAHLKELDEYVIVFQPNKIVIQVLDVGALAKAMDRFLNEILSTAQDGVLTVSGEKVLVGTAGFSILSLGDSKKLMYNVVLPSRATEVEKNIGARIVAMIAKYTGEYPELTYDDLTPYRESTYNILIGRTSYPESSQALTLLARNEYGVYEIGNKLVVAGQISGTLLKAGEMFLDLIDRSGNKAEKSIVIHLPNDWKASETEYLLEFPDFTDGVVNVDMENANKTLMLSYTGVKGKEFTKYCGEVEAMGYTLWQSNQIGDNLFRTYRSESGEICLSLYPSQDGGTMHIFTDRYAETTPIPDADPNYEKVTEATLHVMSLDYSHRTRYDGHGMCYVITLEDGRYIVMDGGYNASYGSKDDERIYNYLVEHNKRPDGKVVIAAWFMSHPHGDHFGAFESFVAKYKDKVTLEYFIANPYTANMGGGNHWMLTNLPGLLKQMRTPLIKPHTGQIITFCNTQLEVIYTHENHYPGEMYDTNNSSTVLRLHQNGHTAIFTGDASVKACNVMTKLYGDELKSDIFQVNHHGCSGGTWALYDMATREDSYVLWTCSKEAFYYRTLGERRPNTVASDDILKPNRDLALKVGWDHCLYADGVVEQITFPEGEEIRISDARDYALDPQTQPEPQV